MTVSPFSRSISPDALRFVLQNCHRHELIERTQTHVTIAIWVEAWGDHPHKVVVPAWKWDQVQSDETGKS